MRHLQESAATFEDWEGVHAAVSDAYFPHALKPVSRGSASRSALEMVDLSDCRLAFMRFGATVDISSDHPGAHAVNIQLRGSMDSAVGGRTIRTTPGEAVALPADTPARLPGWSSDCEILGLRIDRDYLARESERVLGRKGAQLPLHLDLGTPEGPAWFAMARSTFEQARDGGSTLYRNPRMAASVASMLVTGLVLAVVPDDPGASLGLRPRTVRRVMDAVDADPARPWAPADLAEVAGVSVRRLQQAFREHVGTSPLGYVHDVRLAHVRDDLLHGDATSVTETAMHWGVSHMGRFAAAYRCRYGELPSETLENRP